MPARVIKAKRKRNKQCDIASPRIGLVKLIHVAFNWFDWILRGVESKERNVVRDRGYGCESKVISSRFSRSAQAFISASPATDRHTHIITAALAADPV